MAKYPMLRATALVLLGAAFGALAASIWFSKKAERLERNAAFGNALSELTETTLLLALLDANRLALLRGVVEREMTRTLEGADSLASQGASLPFGLAFSGEFREGLDRAQQYALRHRLNPLVTARVRNVKFRLSRMAIQIAGPQE